MTGTHLVSCSPSWWFSYSQRLQKWVPQWNRSLFVVKLYSLGIFFHIWECPEECKNVPCFFSAVLRYVRIKTGLSLEQVGCERKQVWSALAFGARPGQLCESWAYITTLVNVSVYETTRCLICARRFACGSRNLPLGTAVGLPVLLF